MFTDLGPGDLVIALRCGLDSVPGQVVKRYRIGQDPHCLIEGTEPERERERQGDNQWQLVNRGRRPHQVRKGRS